MTKKKKKTFEENLTELENIVEKLENGEISLDDSIEEFNKAMKLAKECDAKLKKAEESLNKIVRDDNTLEDFEIEKDA